MRHRHLSIVTLAALAFLILGCQNKLNAPLPPEDARQHPTLAAWSLLVVRNPDFELDSQFEMVALGLHALERDDLSAEALQRCYQELVEVKAYKDEFQSLLKAAVDCSQDQLALKFAKNIEYPQARIRQLFYLAGQSKDEAVVEEALQLASTDLNEDRSRFLESISGLSALEQVALRTDSELPDLLLSYCETLDALYSPDKAKVTLQETLNLGVERPLDLNRAAVLAHKFGLTESRDDCLNRVASYRPKDFEDEPLPELYRLLERIKTLNTVGRKEEARALLKTVTEVAAPMSVDANTGQVDVALVLEFTQPISETILELQGEDAALDYLERVGIRRALQGLAPHLSSKKACFRALKLHRELDSSAEAFDSKKTDPPFYLLPILSRFYPEDRETIESLVMESLKYAGSMEGQSRLLKILNVVGQAMAQASIPVTQEHTTILEDILESENQGKP